MKRMKRTLAALLAMTMLVPLASCSGTGGGESAPSSSGGVSSGTEPGAEEVETYGGITITLCNAWGKDLTPGQNDETDRFIDRIAEVEEKYDVEFVYAKGPEEYYDNMVTTIMAGEPYGDLMFAFPSYFLDWVKAGAVKDLTDLGLSFEHPDLNPVAAVEGTIDGRVYGFNMDKAEVNSMMAFNKRLFEEAGLESPYDLIERDEWTFATMEEYAKKLTKTDANGNNTQWGLSTFDPPWLGVTMIYANNGKVVDFQSDGTAKFTMDEPNALEAMDLLNKMVNVDKSVLVTEAGEDWSTAVKAFTDGKVGMLRAEQWIIDCFNAWDMADDFGIVYFPKGPKAADYVDDISSQAVYFVPSCVDDERAKAAVTVYMALFSDLYPEMSEEEEAEMRFMAKCRDEESVQFMADVYNKGYTQSTQIGKAGLTDAMPEIFRELFEGKSTPAAIVGEKKASLQAMLDERFAFAAD
ncbi:MAG TPA: extracellular solute-binding protein [Firmicutes bacterium]|nr:extracellular solute-binding protein [Bacillota bacterium]